jgi:hypothetical protein
LFPWRAVAGSGGGAEVPETAPERGSDMSHKVRQLILTLLFVEKNTTFRLSKTEK